MNLFDPRVLGAKPAGLRRERIEASSRFVDGRFENTEKVSSPLDSEPLVKRMSIIGEFFVGGAKRLPPGELPVERPSWDRAAETGLRATWLGHSTVLLEIDGFRVLTDPVWGERVSPVSFAGPKRFHRVPVTIDQMPALDAVLVSHDHYDHLDFPTIRALSRLDVPFVTSLGVGAHLEAWGVAPARIHELDWWEETSICGLTFTAAPSRHFSGRGNGSNRTAWSSFSIRGERHRTFFSGDTGLTPEFEMIAAKLGPFDLLLLEVGAFHPSWGAIHLGPDNAVLAHQMLGGGTLMPIHWGTFDLGLHPWAEPAERLVEIGAGIHLVTPRLGASIEPLRVESVDPWWRQVTASAEAATLVLAK